MLELTIYVIPTYSNCAIPIVFSSMYIVYNSIQSLISCIKSIDNVVLVYYKETINESENKVT